MRGGGIFIISNCLRAFFLYSVKSEVEDAQVEVSRLINQRSSSQGSREEKIKTKLWSAMSSVHTASDQSLKSPYLVSQRVRSTIVTGSDHQIDGLRKVEEKIDQRWESRAGRASCSIIDLMGALEENLFRTIALSLYKQKIVGR